MRDIEQKHAMIDIGSNSIRLVVMGIDRFGFYKQLLNFKVVARLSAYIDDDENLSDAGIAILLQTLRRFQSILKREMVTAVDAVATAAMRKAQNRERVLDCLKEKTGFNIRVLAGLEEAYYGYYAIINSTCVENGISIDIGGGSTEVTIFKDRELVHSHSFPFGAVTLYHSFYAQDDKKADSKLEHFLKEQFSAFDWLNNQLLPVIGIGGSARNLVRIDQAKRHYPMVGLHQYTIPQSRLNELTGELLSLSLEERENLEGLSKDRADIIVPAAKVINTLVTMSKAETFMLSNEGLREGVFYEWLLQAKGVERIPYVLKESIGQLAKNFQLDTAHTGHVKKLAFQLYEGIQPLIKDSFPEDRKAWLLSHSADLAYIGEYINNESSSAHTFYLLTNISINGLSHEDRLALAFISSFKSRSKLNDFAASFQNMVTKEQLRVYEVLGSILRLAHGLNTTRQKLVDHLKVSIGKNKQIDINVHYHDDPYFEEQFAQKQKKHLERALKVPVSVSFEKKQSFV